MKSKTLKFIGLSIALAVFGSVCFVSLRAQQTKLGSSELTTNWTGYLVVGQNESMDKIAPGAFPKTIRHVEIGLRSDGVVVWRNVGN